MKDWIKIELSELAAPVVVALIILTAIASGVNETRAWVLVGDEMERQMLLPWWITGGLLGFFHLGWEDLTNTRNYTRHRGLELERIFRMRIVSGLLVSLAFVVVPLVLNGLAFRIFSDEGGLMFWNRLGPWCVLGLVAPATFAAAGWGINTNGAWTMRIANAIVASCGVVIIARRLADPAPEEWHASLAEYSAIMIAITAAFTWAGRRGFLLSKDLDRPMPMSVTLVDTLCLLLAYSMAFGSVVAKGQERLAMASRSDAASVATLEPTGELALVRRAESIEAPARCAADGSWLTPDGDPSEQPIAVDVESYLFQPWMHWVGLRRAPWYGGDHGRFADVDMAFSEPWEELWAGSGTFGYLDRREGCVWVLRLPSEEGLRPGGRWRLERPDGRAFDRSTLVLGYEDDAPSEVLIGQPGEAALWRVRMLGEVPKLEALDLPGGARFEDWSGSKTLLIGTTGPTLTWDGAELAPSDEVVSPRSQFARSLLARGLRLEATLEGPEEWHVRVTHPGGRAPVFEHSYRLGQNEPGEWNKTWWGITAFGLLRSPVVSLASYWRDPYPVEYGRVSFRRSYLRDPIVAGGRHGRRVVLALCFYGLVAWLLTRPLKKAGATSARTAFWFVTVTLGGVSALLAMASIEALRAWGERPAVRAASPPRLVSRPAGV